MNIAGPLASLIFAITVLTVFGGLFAYGVYKARERTRKKPASTKKVLQYFVEFQLPALPAAHAPGGLMPPVATQPSREGRPWGLYLVSTLAVAGMITAASGSIAPIALPASSDRRLMPIASSGRSVP